MNVQGSGSALESSPVKLVDDVSSETSYEPSASRTLLTMRNSLEAVEGSWAGEVGRIP